MMLPASAAYDEAAGADGRVAGLVIDHLPLVGRIVSLMAPTLASSVSRDDLIGAGTLGLVEAAHRYDPDRGAKFQTFAYPRVRGAIVDFLRENDPLGKSAREQLTRLRRAAGTFRSEHGRQPTIPELAEQAEMPEETALRYLSYEHWDSMCSLEAASGSGPDEGSILRNIIPTRDEGPLEQLEHAERVELLAQAIERLSEREQQIIVMYYYEGLYMAEMAEVLGVSESRISQLHTRALYNLTRFMGGEP